MPVPGGVNGRGQTRILVVDDQAPVRFVVTKALNRVPEFMVVGSAPNGKVGLERLGDLSPDIVVLDVEMPEMDGLEMLTRLRATHPRLPVIMYSYLTRTGAQTTMEALTRGASDYALKPAPGTRAEAVEENVRDELVPRIRALCDRSKGLPRPRMSAPIHAGTPRGKAGRVSAVAIGVSTGGPDALARMFATLPKNLPVPVLIVQHMPPMFTELLATRLTKIGPLRVVEAADGAVLEPGMAYIAPGDWHMTVARAPSRDVRVALHQGPRECSCRPSVDVLFRSAADVYGPEVLGVVMTGMGEDGLRGARALHANGGRLLAQDADSSVVWGMPGAIVRAGLADDVLPLSELASEIARRLTVARS